MRHDKKKLEKNRETNTKIVEKAGLSRETIRNAGNKRDIKIGRYVN